MMYDGRGYIALDYLVTVLIWITALLQVAVLRDRSLPETRFAESCRWLVVAGLVGVALRFTFVLGDVVDIRLPPFSLASLGFLCLGLLGGAVEKLMRPAGRRRCDDPATQAAPPSAAK